MTKLSAALLAIVCPLMASAGTLDAGPFIQQRIARTKPVQIEKLAELFANSPRFSYDCVPDVEIKAKSKVGRLIEDYAPKRVSGTLTVRLDAKKYGFDLGLTKTLDESPKFLPPHYLNTEGQTPFSLSCKVTGDEKAEPSSCASLNMDREMKFDGDLGEGFSNGLEINEVIDISPYSADDMYMTYRLNYMAKETGYWGQPKGTVTTYKAYLCALKRMR